VLDVKVFDLPFPLPDKQPTRSDAPSPGHGRKGALIVALDLWYATLDSFEHQSKRLP